MIHPCENILHEGPSLQAFLSEIERVCCSSGVLSVDDEIDHVCYRVETKTKYQMVFKELLNMGSVLTESMIAGRPISTFLLHEPIVYKSWKIPCIELPSPKDGSYYPTGWEHCEIVIGDSSMNIVCNREYLERFVADHSDVTFDLRAINKEINADVSMRINDDYSVKFHMRPLYEVCKFEELHNLCIPVPEDYFK